MARNDASVLEALSSEASAAVAKAAAAVVTVYGRRRFPSAGVLWRDGFVVTANHALTRDDGITVTLPDGREVPATIAGRDPSTDLAVLTVPVTDAPTVELGDAASLKAGQLTFAVGRVDGVPRASLTGIGLIGGPWRTWAGGEIEQLIRFDRDLHPTLSGGPLVDGRGRVLGINTTGLSRMLGVTVPNVTVNRVMQTLLEKGYVARGYLGLGFMSIPAPAQVRGSEAGTQRCLIVLRVEPEGPASRAGVLVGDLITALDAKPVEDTDDVQRLLAPERVGSRVTAAINRGGKSIEVGIAVGERPRLAGA
jgi:S1-C subfamily serine protease